MPWPLMSCGKPTTAASRHDGVGHQSALDFRRAEPMAGHIDHIVDAAGDPVIAVFIAAAAVAGEIHAGESREVSFNKALRIAIERARLSGPGISSTSGPSQAPVAGFVVLIQNRWLHAEERTRRRPGLQRRSAGQRRDQYPAGFSLPPGVDDRAAAVADNAMIPKPGFRIDRLADGAQQAKAFARRSS